jgi:hypothetical protein
MFDVQSAIGLTGHPDVLCGFHFGNVLSSGSRRHGRAGRCAAPDDSRSLTGVVIHRLLFKRSRLPCEGSRIRSTGTVRGYLWVYGRVRRLIRHGCAVGEPGACEWPLDARLRATHQIPTVSGAGGGDVVEVVDGHRDVK